ARFRRAPRGVAPRSAPPLDGGSAFGGDAAAPRLLPAGGRGVARLRAPAGPRRLLAQDLHAGGARGLAAAPAHGVYGAGTGGVSGRASGLTRTVRGRGGPYNPDSALAGGSKRHGMADAVPLHPYFGVYDSSEAALYLRRLLRERYTVGQLRNVGEEEFRAHVTSLPGRRDPQRERFQDISRQRDLSVQFEWGHNHDFGTFRMTGLMQDRHIHILATFMTLHHVAGPALPLRIGSSALKDGGHCLLETMAADGAGRYCEYGDRKDRSLRDGAASATLLGGWDWFVPSLGAVRAMLQDTGFEVR